MEDKVNQAYDYLFNNLKTDKEYASIVVDILNAVNQEKTLSIQDALDVLNDTSKIILMIKAL